MQRMIADKISDNNDNLATVVVARGAGDGSNAPTITVFDPVAILDYGKRVISVSFPSVTDYAVLTTKANETLDYVKVPRADYKVTHVLEEHEEFPYNVGDTISAYDRITNVSITARILNLQNRNGRVTLHLNSSLRSPLDVITQAQKEENRTADLGLQAPVDVQARGSDTGGIHLTMNAYTNSRAIGVRIHLSTTQGFTPDSSTLHLRNGTGNVFDLKDGLTTNEIYYIRVQTYGDKGPDDFSPFSEEVFAKSASFLVDGLAAGSITDLTPFASAIRPVINVQTLPSLPNDQFIEGQMVNLNGTMYEVKNGAWELAVKTEDLVGQITGDQLNDALLDFNHFAPNLRPISIVTSLPPLPDPNYPVGSSVSFNSETYRNDANVWDKSVRAADLSGLVQGPQIAIDAIDTQHIVNNAINTAQIANGAIDTLQIASGAVQSGNLDDLAVTSQKLAADSVKNVHIDANAVSTAQIADAAIQTAQLANGAVNTLQIASGAVQSGNLDDLAVTAGKLAAGAVQNVNLDIGVVQAPNIADDAIDTQHIIDNAIKNAQIDANAVGELQLAADSVSSNNLQDNAVLAANLAAGAVQNVNLDIGVVQAPNIANDAIDTQHIIDNAIGNAQIANNAVDTLQLASGAVQTSNLDSLAVTASKLAGGAVGPNHLQVDAVTATAIAAGAIVAGKVAANAIGANEIAAKSIVAKHLAIGDFDNLIKNANFSVGAIDGDDDPHYYNGGAGGTWVSSTASHSAGRSARYYVNGQTATAHLIFNGNSSDDSGVHVATRQGDKFYFELYSRFATTAPTVAPQLYMQIRDANGVHVEGETVTTLTGLTTSFTKYSTEYTVTNPNASYVVFYIRIGTGNPNTTNLYFDSIYARRMDEGNLIVDGTLAASKIVANSLTSGQIASNAITTLELDAGAVTSDKIFANTIQAADIAAGAIGVSELDANSVTANAIATGAIVAGKVAADAIGATQIIARSITATKLAIGDFDNLIKFGEINNTIFTESDPNVYLENGGSWTSSATTYRTSVRALRFLSLGQTGLGAVYFNGSLQEEEAHVPATHGDRFYFRLYARRGNNLFSVQPRMISASLDVNGTYLDGTIKSLPLTKVWTEYEVEYEVVNSQARYVVFYLTVDAANGAVNASLYIDSIYARRMDKGNLIVDGTLAASKIVANSLTSDQIASNAITTLELDAGAVRSDNIFANTIQAGDIAANAIGVDELDANSVTANAIATGAIVAGKVAADAIGANEIAAKSIVAQHLAIGSFDNMLTNGSFLAGVINSEDDPNYYTLGGGNGTWDASTAPYSGRTARFNVGSTQTTAAWLYFNGSVLVPELHSQCAIGDRFYVQVYTRRSTTDWTNPPVLFGQFRTITGNTATGSFSTVMTSMTTDYQLYELEFECTTATSAFVWFGIYIPAGNHANCALHIDGAYARRMDKGKLVVDGTLSATKLIANSITADQIEAGAIGVDELDANSVTSNAIAAGAVVAGAIAADTVGANEIAAGAITAKHLTIGDFDNLLQNGNAKLLTFFDNKDDPNRYTKNGGTWLRDTTEQRSGDACFKYSTTGQVGTAWLRLNGSTSSMYRSSHPSASVGDQFHCSVWVKRGTLANARNPQMCVYRLRADGTNAGVTVTNMAISDTWQQFTRTVEITEAQSDTAYVAFQIRLRHEVDGVEFYFDDAYFRRMDTGALIVDGSIVGNHIVSGSIQTTHLEADAVTVNELAANSVVTSSMVANSISGDRITVGTLNGDKIIANTISSLQIDANAINTSELAAGAVSADKIQVNAVLAKHLLVGDFENILNNGNFALDAVGGPNDTNHYAHGGGNWYNNAAAKRSGLRCLGFNATTQTSGAAVYFNGPTTQASHPTATLGDTYYFRVYHNYAGTYPVNFPKLVIAEINAAGSYNGGSVVQMTNMHNNWRMTETSYTVANATSVRVVAYIHVDSGNNTWFRFDDALMRRMDNGKLIVDGSIQTNHMTAGSIDADRLVTNSIQAGQIAAGAVRVDELDANAVTASKLATDAIESRHIRVGTIEADMIKNRQITQLQIGLDQVTADLIATNAVLSANIASGQINHGHVQTDAIRANNIQAGSITTAKLQVNSVNASKIRLDGVMTITDPNDSSSRIDVRNSTNQTQVAIGDIGGFTHAGKVIPVNTHGIWMGANAQFLTQVVKQVKRAYYNMTFTQTMLGSDARYKNYNNNKNYTVGTIDIPAGMRAIPSFAVGTETGNYNASGEYRGRYLYFKVNGTHYPDGWRNNSNATVSKTITFEAIAQFTKTVTGGSNFDVVRHIAVLLTVLLVDN